MCDLLEASKCSTSAHAPFNQLSTNRLLQQLRMSMQDVEATIQKSKNRMGIQGGWREGKGDERDWERNQRRGNFGMSVSVVRSSGQEQIDVQLSHGYQSKAENQLLTKTTSQNTLIKIPSSPPLHSTSSTNPKSSNPPLNKTNPNPKHPLPNYLIHQYQIKQSQLEYEQSINDQQIRNEKETINGKNCQQQDLKQGRKILENNQKKKMVKNCGRQKGIYQKEEKDKYGKKNYIERKSYEKTQNSRQRIYQSINKQYKTIELSKQKSPKKPKHQSQNPNTKSTSPQIYSKNSSQNPIPIQHSPTNQLTKSTTNMPKFQHFITTHSQLPNTCAQNQLEYILFNKLKKTIKQSTTSTSNPKNTLPSQHTYNNQNLNKSILHSKPRMPQPTPIQPHNKSPTTTTSIPKTNSPIKKPTNLLTNSIHTYLHKCIHQKMHKLKPKKKLSQQNKLSINDNSNVPLQISTKQQPNKTQIQHQISSDRQNPNSTTTIHSPNPTRNLFLTQMKTKCYVNRFLSPTQLNNIYDQFIQSNLTQNQWTDQIIKKIFNKIHNAEEII